MMTGVSPYRRAGEPEGEYAIFLRHANGHRWRVTPGPDHTLGSDVDSDIVVNDPRVVPHHAIVVIEGAGLRVRASDRATNGPPVIAVDDVSVGASGASSALARHGSHLRVGDTALVVESGAAVEHEYESRLAKKRLMRRVIGLDRSMSGSLDELPLPDLLLLLGTSKRSGVLVLRRPNDDVGRIWLRRGEIVDASVNEGSDLSPMEEMFPMFEWPDALFDLEPLDTKTIGRVSLSVEDVVRDGVARLHERS
jgi:hypothetical protein